MKNVIIYTRVSTDEQAQKGTSLPFQKERLEQFCSVSGDTIVNHFEEDYSAKNFEDRPSFNKLLAYLKANKGFVYKLLVVRWDRFSRNAPDAYNMIAKLKKLGIEVNSVEQPINYGSPEHKIMLSFYLTIPEIENDRRALNTTNGMRKNMLDGNWVSTAPFGYSNKRDALNKPTLQINDKAEFIKKAFEYFAEGTYDIDYLRKMLNNKFRYNVSRNSFWKILRNPVYTGKIRVKEYDNEPEQIVKGKHEPIVSDDLFDEVQFVLSGKKRIKAKKKTVNEFLPMRGFLVCSCCGKNLTGSASKGNGGTYYYYHCQPGCKERYKTDIAHSEFSKWLSSISIKPEIASLYLSIMEDIFKTNEGDRDKEILRLENELAKNRAMLDKIAEKYIHDGLDKDMYHRLTDKQKIEITSLKIQIEELKQADTGFNEYSRFGFSLLSNLSYYYNQSNLENKQKMIGLIFPEKLVFTNSSYRTTKPNELLTLMCNNINDLGVVKTKKTSNNESLSLMVEAAYRLWKAGKIERILISGDNGWHGYNEPQDFMDEFIALGVPDSCLICDFAGFRTHDSVIRCKKVFGQQKVTIISQQFHNERALFIAKKYGMDAIAYNADDVSFRSSLYTFFREKAARVLLFADLYVLNTAPHFLGKKVIIN